MTVVNDVSSYNFDNLRVFLAPHRRDVFLMIKRSLSGRYSSVGNL